MGSPGTVDEFAAVIDRKETEHIDLMALVKKPDTSIAIIGATDNPSKFGNIIYHDLKRKGFRLFPVNHHRTLVAGDRAYTCVQDLPVKPSLITFVVPPSQTLTVLDVCLVLGYMNVWIQPGAASQAVRTFLMEHAFNYVIDDCIMVHTAAVR